MEVEPLASDVENVAEDAVKPEIDDKAAGDTTVPVSERAKKKLRRVIRQNSKESASPASNHIPQPRGWKNSRRPRNGHGRGLPKKGGGGGKGVWGLPGSEMLEEYVEDMNDPNYDPEAANGDIELKQVIIDADPEEVVHKTEPIVLEYFENADSNEAIESFLEYVTPKRTHLIVETIVEIALDHKPSHCEMASVLISDLYGRLCSAKDIGFAFERLLDKLPDLLLDTPDAVTLVSKFVARAVADDCLPPRFVHTAAAHDGCNAHAKQAIQRAHTLLSMKHGLVRLDNIWGVGGGVRAVKALIRQIQLLIKEYVTSGDIGEATRCVRDLEVPHFHHEIVYETVVMALEAVNTAVEEQLCTFLAEMRKAVIITPDQMDKGFLRVLDDMTDIVLDVPLAYITLDRFVERCNRKFKLGDHVMKKMPTRGRKRFVSEGDGGIIKEHALKLRE